jgi:hypothetical protein
MSHEQIEVLIWIALTLNFIGLGWYALHLMSIIDRK